MLRVHFTAVDLARTHIVASYGPYSEAMFSLGVLRDRRREALFDGWRQQLTDASGGWAGVLSRLIGSPPVLDLFTLIGRVRSDEESTQALLSVDRRHLKAEVDAAANWAAANRSSPDSELPAWAFRLPEDRAVRFAFAARMQACCAAAIGPHWNHIQAHLDAEAAVRARVLAQGGIEQLLSTLHPDLRWRDGALQVQDGTSRSADVYLNGSGLALVPSVFCRRIASYHISDADRGGPAVLFYPALREVKDAYRLWARTDPTSTHKTLVALLGSTRAAALDIICQGCTTTELARRLGVSPPTASYHATILRNAGLISTRRHGSVVVHNISPLGASLLDGDRHVPGR